MKVYAIGDLHLPGGQDKPMDVFGGAWADHPARIAANWQDVVAPTDVVLVAGDLSWAMTLAEAQPDLDYLGKLTGRIILVKGNHDYWWSSLAQVRRALPANVAVIQNDCVMLTPDWAVCGTRGWTTPGSMAYGEPDEKIYRREVQRLELSLNSALKAGAQHIVALLHYPPLNEQREPSDFTALLERYPVAYCVYGHLHAAAKHHAFIGRRNGIEYRLVACDAIDFRPAFICELPNE